MTLSVNIERLLEDPISHERLQDPVVNGCGHTFERAQISGWVAQRRQSNLDPSCPLCRQPISNLVSNRILKEVIGILQNDANSLANGGKDLTYEERKLVENAIKKVEERRRENDVQGIPHRLDPPHSFINRAVIECKKFYRC